VPKLWKLFPSSQIIEATGMLKRNACPAEQEWQSCPDEPHVHSQGDQQTEDPGGGPAAHITHDERSVPAPNLPETEIEATAWSCYFEIEFKRGKDR
jgi:hypothetical protein